MIETYIVIGGFTNNLIFYKNTSLDEAKTYLRAVIQENYKELLDGLEENSYDWNELYSPLTSKYDWLYFHTREDKRSFVLKFCEGLYRIVLCKTNEKTGEIDFIFLPTN